jgi:hypothetical protein
MDLYERLTKHRLSFITSGINAEEFVKEVKAPKCKELFITVIDGVPPIWNGVIMQKRR